MAAIIPMYLMYPLIYKHILLKSDKKGAIYIALLIALSYGVCVVVALINYKYFRSVEIGLTRFPVFFLGCYFGKYVYEDRAIGQFAKKVSIFALVWGFYFFYFHPFSLVKYYRIPYLLVGPSLALWGAVALDYLKKDRLNDFLKYCGAISLELYLAHFALRRYTLDMHIYGKSHMLNLGIYFCIVILGGFLISIIARYVCDKMLKNTVCFKYNFRS